MKLKNLIKILIIALVILLIVILIIALIYNRNKHKASPSVEIPEVSMDTELKYVSNRNNYYVVKSCINIFYTYYNGIYNSNEMSSLIMDEETTASLENVKKQDIEAVYNILDEDYKTYKNITLDNLTSKLPSINTNKIDITNMYVTEEDKNISIYFVYGYLIDTSSMQTSKFSMIVKIDMLNRTFSVLLEDYMKENYNNIKVGENVDINYSNEIKSNDYNKFKFEIITDDAYIADIFSDFKQNMIYNDDEVYKNLDETYREKRFSDVKDFEEYVNNRIREITVMNLSKYQKTIYDNYTQYVCLTNKDEYIIINEISPMKYSFILDTYTIDLPEFLEKYNNSTDQQKVALNIDKFMQAINAKDYKYAYNCLADSFKNNYFKTQEEFENYAKENFYSSNNVEYNEFDTQGDVYTYSVILTDKETSEQKNKTFIVKLEEGTEFVLSFNR